MPSKATRGGKTHSRTSSTGKLNKSLDKIKRPPETQIRRHGLRVDVMTTDDDEWISSESGAVTPASPEDVPPSPHHDDDPPPSSTPRADHPPRPRPRPQSMADLPRLNTDDQRSPDSLYHPTPAHTSPPPRRPHSARSAHTRPHPLIRALSSHSTATFSPTSPTLRRQTSHSSITSIATLPLPTTSTTTVHGVGLRPTTPSAALSSLTAATLPHPPQPTRPRSPPFPVTFPQLGTLDQTHVMIPPPLVPPHASATAHQDPFGESLRRVAEAKARAGR